VNLSILTVTRGEPHTKRFFTHFRAVADILRAEFVLAYDGCDKPDCGADKYLAVRSSGAIEDVLVEAHRACSGGYVLRLDDDETLSPAAILSVAEANLDGRVFALPRANLWGDERHAITNGHLFPDWQARLMPRDREDRTTVHAGVIADAAAKGVILHHKFLVKSLEERRAIASRYESKSAGCGTGHYLQFSVPEDCFSEPTVVEFASGRIEVSTNET
jgi:hypothetical protein